jgi:hypothetical protein
MRALVPALLLLGGCIAPNVLDESRRSVQASDAVVWRPARADDLSGLFESTAIEGESAAALGKVYYHFSRDGSYTGAALVIGGAVPEFQTLSGRWTLDERGLDLGDGSLVRASAAEGRLRFESDAGVATFRRVAVE